MATKLISENIKINQSLTSVISTTSTIVIENSDITIRFLTPIFDENLSKIFAEKKCPPKRRKVKRIDSKDCCSNRGDSPEVNTPAISLQATADNEITEIANVNKTNTDSERSDVSELQLQCALIQNENADDSEATATTAEHTIKITQSDNNTTADNISNEPSSDFSIKTKSNHSTKSSKDDRTKATAKNLSKTGITPESMANGKNNISTPKKIVNKTNNNSSRSTNTGKLSVNTKRGGDVIGRTTVWKKSYVSPFKSPITAGPRKRENRNQSGHFSYHLSKDELHFTGKFKGPMKEVPASERELLHIGPSAAYLTQRYERSPVRKYNYPEATSWRIGWFHNQHKQQTEK